MKSIKKNKNNLYNKKSCNCPKKHTITLEFNGEKITYSFINQGTYHKFLDALENKYFLPKDTNKPNNKLAATQANIDYVNKILGIIRDKLRKQSVGVRGEQESQTSVSAKKLPQSGDVSDATNLDVSKKLETKDDISALENSLKRTKEYKNFTGILKSTDTGLYYLCKEGKIHTANLYRFKREGLKKKLKGDEYKKTPFINYLRSLKWSYPSAIQKKYEDLYDKYDLKYLEKAGPRIKVNDKGEEIKEDGDKRTTFGTVSLLNDEQKFRMYFLSETTSTKTMSDMLKSGEHKFNLIHKTVEMTAREIRNNLELRLSNGVPVDNIIEYEKSNVQPKSYDLSTKIYFEKANKISYNSKPPTYEEIKNYDITATGKQDVDIKSIMGEIGSTKKSSENINIKYEISEIQSEVFPNYFTEKRTENQKGFVPNYVVMNSILLTSQLKIIQSYLNTHWQALGFAEVPEIKITSGYRSKQYTESLGKKNHSAHQWGGAADIATVSKYSKNVKHRLFIVIRSLMINNYINKGFMMTNYKKDNHLHIDNIKPYVPKKYKYRDNKTLNHLDLKDYDGEYKQIITRTNSVLSFSDVKESYKNAKKEIVNYNEIENFIISEIKKSLVKSGTKAKTKAKTKVELKAAKINSFKKKILEQISSNLSSKTNPRELTNIPLKFNYMRTDIEFTLIKNKKNCISIKLGQADPILYSLKSMNLDVFVESAIPKWKKNVIQEIEVTFYANAYIKNIEVNKKFKNVQLEELLNVMLKNIKEKKIEYKVGGDTLTFTKLQDA